MNRPVKKIVVPPERANTLVAGAVLSVLLVTRALAAAPATPAPDDPEAKAKQEAQLLELFQSDSDTTNSLDMLMVHVPQGYRVAKYEVTQSDYQQIMGDNPSRFEGARRPVEQVTWGDAKAFCERLTSKERDAGLIPPGYSYALPTEAQWEYYVDETSLDDSITSHLGDRRNTENVGGLGPNKFGLHDTRGNVWEWSSSPVARGGSWQSHEDYLALSFRFVGDPAVKYDDIGFRIVLQETGGSR
jgi:formylglycine-generating enzyme required for sulfatase activity